MRLALSSLLLLAACGFGKFTPNPEYCGYNDGDAYCERTTPDKPYCIVGRQSCLDAAGIDASDPYGCVAQLPALECRDQCGQDNADMCLDPTDPSSSSTTEDETDSSTTEDPTADTDESSSSTGPACMNNEECTDPAAPFCDDGACVPCSSTAAPELACMELDPTTPLCIDDACVQCTAEDASACGGTTPVCGPANACVACEYHEQCEALDSPACDFTDGSCFDPSTAMDVDLSGDDALAMAIGLVGEGEHIALRVTGDPTEAHSATVGNNKVIAIVSANGDTQNIQGAGANSILTVNGPGSTAILHRLVLQGSAARGIDVNTSGTLYADAVRIAGNDGGGINLGTATTARLRNCMVAGVAGNPGVPALSATNATVDVLYSTLAVGFNSGSTALECSGGDVTVRNSILLSETSTSNSEVDCDGITIETSARETTLSPTDWFPGFASGDYSLNSAGGMQFGDIARWKQGDPPTDFDGDARPSTDDSADFAGADIP